MNISILGVPIDFGSGRRGVDMGPSAIRYTKLQRNLKFMGHKVNDLGNIAVPILETCQVNNPKLKYADCIIPVTRRLEEKITNICRADSFPLILGGDHSLSIGSVRGVSHSQNLGLIWMDAHGDFNTDETTPSGNLHGMSLASIAGYGTRLITSLGKSQKPVIHPSKIVIVGVRKLDPEEKVLLKKSGVSVYSMTEIDRLGMHEVVQQAIAIVANGTDGIYLSLDMDVIDPLYAPGVGTPVQGGITYREAHLVCETIENTGLLKGMEIVEVNPILDDRNKTGTLAMELTLSALGKKVF